MLSFKILFVRLFLSVFSNLSFAAEEPQIQSNIGGFKAGTEVWTPYGTTPIQRLKSGDAVLSFDLKTGTVVSEKVINTYKYQQAGFWFISTKDGSELTVNKDHKFYLPINNSWVKAEGLRTGTEILTKDGGKAEIVISSAARGNEILYEITVSNAHNYFVGKQGILVHNFAFVLPVATWVIGEGIIWASTATIGVILAASYIMEKNDGTPKCNQAQNAQARAAGNKYKLDEKQRRRLHDAITGCNFGYDEIERIAKEIKTGWSNE